MIIDATCQILTGEQTLKDYLKTWRRPSRPSFTGNCLIWSGAESEISPLNKPTGPNLYKLEGHHVNSPRAGGHYVLWQRAKPLVEELDEHQKARLTTWLIDQREQGDLAPEITPNAVEYAIQKPKLHVHERAERLLKCLVSQSDTIGDSINVQQNTPRPYAWSESVTWQEVVYLLNYLRDNEWLDHSGTNERINQTRGLINGVVTVAGYNHVAEQSVAFDSSQVFVAMWFDPEVKQIYDQGIAPAVEAAGYTPFRIDQGNFLGKIDDQILAEIRRSRFLIADMTHGDKGARGGVYFEAGFALGLGLPVIYTCRSDMYDELHFDTRQYPHIEWTNDTIESFRQNLENRIRASIT